MRTHHYYVDHYNIMLYSRVPEAIGESKSRGPSVGGLSQWPQSVGTHLIYIIALVWNYWNAGKQQKQGELGPCLVPSGQSGNGNGELLKLKIDQGGAASITRFGTTKGVMHYPNYWLQIIKSASTPALPLLYLCLPLYVFYYVFYVTT